MSASRPGSSMPASDVRISGGIFLFSFTYWSNCEIIARRMASSSVRVLGLGRDRARLRGVVRLEVGDRVDARTLDASRPAPSPCRPAASASAGCSRRCRCRTCPPPTARPWRPISGPPAGCSCPASMAVSSALIDFGRPTNSGITMCGKTTTSRSGSSGRVSVSAPDSVSVMLFT